jgi:CheY-like chemotaxis protein
MCRVLRILVVEDNDDSREMMEEVLHTTGKHDISAVATAEEALEQLRTEPFDLIVTDIGLPGATGIQMLDQARDEGLLMEADVVVCSANDEAGRSVRARGDSFILKPAEIAAFVDAVRASRSRIEKSG